MTAKRSLSILDQLLIQTDRALRAVAAQSPHSERPSPAAQADSPELDAADRQHVAGLMRINHTGEVCAQALYQGQALTARLANVRDEMQQAMIEEEDHLAWCQQRLDELDSRPSMLNPLFYSASFGVGAIAGIAGDKWSLGFVAETEKQVCRHLENHLQRLPKQDHKSRAILEQMNEDEARHADHAVTAGGAELPAPIRLAMALMSKVMTKTTYHI